MIADLLSKELCEGWIQEFDVLCTCGKKINPMTCHFSMIVCLKSYVQRDVQTRSKRIVDISDVRIRDNAVRTVLPILLFRDEVIDGLVEATTAGSLRDIVDSLISGNNERIFFRRDYF